MINKKSYLTLIFSISLFLIVSFSCKKSGDSWTGDIYDLSGVEASSKVKDLIKNDILKFVKNDAIVKEILASNQKTQAELKVLTLTVFKFIKR